MSRKTIPDISTRIEKPRPEIALEGDIAEAQRRHHGEGPIEAGEPGVLLALPLHEDVEDDGIEPDHRQDQEQEAHEAPHIALPRAVLGDRGQLRREHLHYHSTILSLMRVDHAGGTWRVRTWQAARLVG
jgi:hypothetical protein